MSGLLTPQLFPVNGFLAIASIAGENAQAVQTRLQVAIDELAATPPIQNEAWAIDAAGIAAAGAGGRWLAWFHVVSVDPQNIPEDVILSSIAVAICVEGDGSNDSKVPEDMTITNSGEGHLGRELQEAINAFAGANPTLTVDLRLVEMAGCNTGHRFVALALVSAELVIP